MMTRINVLNNNHKSTLTCVGGTLFNNTPACFGQCKTIIREVVTQTVTELIKACINFCSILTYLILKRFKKFSLLGHTLFLLYYFFLNLHL